MNNDVMTSWRENPELIRWLTPEELHEQCAVIELMACLYKLARHARLVTLRAWAVGGSR